MINTGKSSGQGFSWALNELHQSVHYYGYFDKNQSDYLFGLAVGNDGNAEWAKAQLLNNVVDITIDDLYYMYLLGDMTVTQNDNDIELAIKKKLYAPVFEHGLEIFTSGLFLGFTAVEFAYLSAPVAARAERIIEEITPEAGAAANIAVRQAYVQEVRGLSSMESSMRESGASLEAIARALHQARRDIGVKYKDMTSPELLEEIYARNIEKYGDKLGPSFESLVNRGKSFENIIDSAKRTSPEFNKRAGIE